MSDRTLDGGRGAIEHPVLAKAAHAPLLPETPELEQVLARDGARFWLEVYAAVDAAARATRSQIFRPGAELRSAAILVREARARAILQITRADNPPAVRLTTFRPILQTVDLPLRLNTAGALVAGSRTPMQLAELALHRLLAVANGRGRAARAGAR
jgi:hypothetical protein